MTDLSPARQWTALAVLILPVLVIAIDNTVLAFAVPSISADLRPTASELLWIVDAYAFVLAGLLITMGNLGDRIGRRRLLLVGATAFAVASVLAAYSTTAAMLIAARALLGVAGATLMPSTLSLIRTIFSDPSRRRVAIGLWSSGFAVGSALGPILGGWLLEHAWWGSVFLMAVPVMALLVIAGPFLLPESRNDRPGPFDPASSLLSLGAVLPVVYAMKRTAEHGPAPASLAFVVVGVAIGVVFVTRQRRLEEPMLDIALFSNREFSTAIFVNLVINFSFIGSIVLVAQYLQLVVGIDPLDAAMHLVPGTVASFFASIGAAAFLRRVRPGPLIAAGLVSAAIGFLLLTTLDATSDGQLVTVAMVFIGLGAGWTASLGANLVMAVVPARRAGSASAVSETAFELGAAAGIAVLGSVVNAVYRRNMGTDTLGHLGEQVTAGRASNTIAEAVEVAVSLPTAVGSELLDAAHEAFASGVRAAAVLGALVALGAAAIALRSLQRVRVAPQDATIDTTP